MLSNHLILCCPFSFCPQSFPASGTFAMSQLFASDDQNTGVSALSSVLPKSIQGWFTLIDWFDLLAVQGTFRSLLQHHRLKALILWCSSFFTVSSHIRTWSLRRCIVKAMVFQVVMYSCESCTVKKEKWQKMYAFNLWCWRRLLKVPWTVRKSNQSILREISPEYSLKGLMLKPKLQYFGHLMQTDDSLVKSLILGKI